jgi:hypothetical protein
MNEKFKQLADQAKLEIFPAPQHGFSVIAGTDQHLQKFAELIVRECAELTLDHKNDDYYNGWLDYRDEINRHFGVAE